MSEYSTCIGQKFVIFILIQALVVHGLVVLEFDGSLRPPKDSGRPTIPTKLGTSASAISILASESDVNGHLRVGSRRFAVDPEVTSTHAEYNGLLLGLEHLCHMTCTKSLPMDDNSKSLLIQGDSKVVLDQLSGKSTPRKVQSLHQLAQEYLESLQSSTHFEKIEFVHVPRIKNHLCDNLCANLIHITTIQDWKDCAQDIEEIGKKILNEDNTDLVAQIFSKYFQMRDSTRRRAIPYSLRPPLYRQMMRMARQTKEWESMIQIGEQLVTESRQVQASEQASLVAEGVRYQVEGQKGLGEDRKAQFLLRKHRVVLSRENACSDNDTDLTRLVASDGKIRWDVSIGEKWKPLLGKWESESLLTSWIEDTSLWVD